METTFGSNFRATQWRASAEALAGFIVDLVNDNQKSADILLAARRASGQAHC
jgi:hypothetical protein